ncbi:MULTISPECIES: ABC transporter ATP-binding protein [Bacillus cereus group]|uniref:Multidrug ABC transporter ATP-binding protein n=2 Tax=Bacillus cereus TaxID=1396 RepID=A0A9W5VES8_BACCE|nr:MULTISPECIES: ABC transporter ATP-binding protein [Bacillus cereus group]AHZ54498.1 ABC-type transport system,membrane ATPase component [Bacillus thuringiensis serovar kurstaki str. YBT-1520]AIE37549.1 ABC-type transport system,membrane ATPase component [Bacillus thuringiensis serovar kurstaki str. HD-1]AIM35109.1 ABC transporter-like protein [Bacillus thuringiensis serovar kurstaki str. YBT-1520]AJK37645.1 ABC transporter family protein [Bacillus thuringiensis serovar kurstaki]EOP30631.1 h
MNKKINKQDEIQISYKELLFLYPYLKNTKTLLALGLIGMVIASLIIAPIPYIIGYIIDKVILLNKSYDQLLKTTLILLLIYCINYLISIGYEYLFTRVQQNVVNEIRLSMISNIIDAPLSYINQKEKGYILSRIAESGNVSALFSPNLLRVFSGIFDFFFALFIMFNLSVKLTGIIVIIIPIYFIISKHSSKMISKSTTNVYESSAVLNAEMYETLNGIEDIKLLNGKNIQTNKIKSKLNNVIKSALKQSLHFIFFMQNLIVTNNFVTVIVLLVSGILILQNQLTIGVYTSFSIYMAKLLATTQALGSLDITLKPVCISIKRIKEFFNLDVENTLGTNIMKEPINSIEFKDVCFKYNGNSDLIFDHLNVQIEKGDKLLIDGINGSGKSTFIKLLTGLYQPESGKILINNIDYNLIHKESVRDRIGIVSQNIFLFKGTILDNILYGQTNKTKEDVVKLMKRYHLTSHLNRFENGLDTIIVQDGSSVSGGQAQFIAFLRAILTKRDIIILDEAASNLHIDTRNLMYEILQNYNLCNILIMISHQQDGLYFLNKTLELTHGNKRIALNGSML